MKSSCLYHEPKDLMAIVRRAYYRLTGDAVSAALISFFEYKANGYFANGGQDEEPWIDGLTIPDFEEALMGLSTDKQIRKRLSQLEEWGYLETKKSLAHHKGKLYRIRVNRLNQDLKSLSEGDQSKERLVIRSNNRKLSGQITGRNDQPLRSNDRIHCGQMTGTLRSNDRINDDHSLYIDLENKEVCIEALRAKKEDTHTQIKDFSGEGKTTQSVIPFAKPKSSQVCLATTKVSGVDRFSGAVAKHETRYDSALGIRPPAPKPKYLIPDGDWLDSDGRLDDSFLTSIAKQWQKSKNAAFHELPIEEVKALVYSHFVKSPDALAVKWEAYTLTSKRHAEAVKIRLDAGINIPEAEQAEIIGKGRAIASAMSESQESVFASPVLNPDTKRFGFEVLPESQVSEPKALPRSPEPQIVIDIPVEKDGQTYNPQAYQPFIPEEITLEQQKANLDRLTDMIRSNARRMPLAEKKSKRAPSLFPRNLAEANEWLSDTVLRQQAVLWADREGYLIDYDEYGKAIEIFEF